MTSLVINVPGEYISLGLVLQSALEQASKGKGKERHASEGEAYESQIICEVTRRLGSGYPLGQAVKKIYEAQRLDGKKGIAELLGAINYIAAAVIVAKDELEAEEKKPRFKRGDRVQYRVVLPSVSDWIWRDATYLRPAFCWQQDGEHIVSSDDLGPVTVKDKDIRPSPKAEGVEELVQDNEVERVFGTLKKRPAPEYDAPQTKEELFNRIMDCNPATYGRAHKPTGEELAEMAEEDGNA